MLSIVFPVFLEIFMIIVLFSGYFSIGIFKLQLCPTSSL